MAIDIAQHGGCDVDGENVVSGKRAGRGLAVRLWMKVEYETYASVKKPTPATRQTFK